MRSISVSTDVYAAIWAARESGEDNEDSILSRLLGARHSVKDSEKSKSKKLTGFYEPRFDIRFPEGFEIFRNYKGVEYRARAIDGSWVLSSTGASYPSLNRLSRATSGNVENAWRNWYFMGQDGKRHLVEGLRSDVSPNVRHLLEH